MTPALPNGRDLGGTPTGTGARLRPGLLLRSAAPGDPDSPAALDGLGVSHVVDLRTEAERQQRPNVVPPGVTQVHDDLLADQPDAGPASLGRLAVAALAGDAAALEPRSIEQFMIAGYQSFVTLPSARAGMRRLLRLLAADDAAQPVDAVLVHCTAGKDRTGWAIALVLSVLDVAGDDIMADYLASGPAVAALFAPVRDVLAERGGDVAAMDRAIGVYPHYLDAAFDAMRQQYGSLDEYLRRGLELPDGVRERLAARLLTG